MTNGFKIIGISARTINKNNQSQQDIAKLWEQAIIGVSGSALNEIPNGLIGREFKADSFQKFMAQGKMPNAVINTWIDIWEKTINSIENTVTILNCMEKSLKTEKTLKLKFCFN